MNVECRYEISCYIGPCTMLALPELKAVYGSAIGITVYTEPDRHRLDNPTNLR